jgi:hypothetical protein
MRRKRKEPNESTVWPGFHFAVAVAVDDVPEARCGAPARAFARARVCAFALELGFAHQTAAMPRGRSATAASNVSSVFTIARPAKGQA